jgi:hypothetical protein
MDPQGDFIQTKATIYSPGIPCLQAKTNPNLQYLCPISEQNLSTDPISCNPILFRQNPEKQITNKHDLYNADMYESHMKTLGSSLSRSDQGSLSSNDITSISPAKLTYLFIYISLDQILIKSCAIQQKQSFCQRISQEFPMFRKKNSKTKNKKSNRKKQRIIFIA